MSRANLTKVVIPVAGLGTRGLPFTKTVPKELLPVIDTPTLHYIVEEVLEAGLREVIFVTSRGKSALEDYFDPAPELETTLESRGKKELAQKMKRIGEMVQVSSVRQKEPLGLGHAVACAGPLVGEEMFAVCLGDQIFPRFQAGAPREPDLKRMVDIAREMKASVVGVMEIPIENSTSYGIVDTGGIAVTQKPVKVKRTVEKPKPEAAPSAFAVIGRYVFTAEIFEKLRATAPGVGGEIQLTDAMNQLAQEGKLYASLIEPEGYDMGNHLSFVKAQIESALARNDLKAKMKEYLTALVGRL